MNRLLPVFSPFFAVRKPCTKILLGGLLLGTYWLFLARHRSSLGGATVVSLYLQARYGMRAGKVQMMIDGTVVVLGTVCGASDERVFVDQPPTGALRGALSAGAQSARKDAWGRQGDEAGEPHAAGEHAVTDAIWLGVVLAPAESESRSPGSYSSAREILPGLVGIFTPALAPCVRRKPRLRATFRRNRCLEYLPRSSLFRRICGKHHFRCHGPAASHPH